MRLQESTSFVAVALAVVAVTIVTDMIIAELSISVFAWAKSAWKTEIQARPTEFYLLHSLLSQIVYLLVAVLVTAVFGIRGAIIMGGVLVSDHLAYPLIARVQRGISIPSTGLWHDALTYVTATVSGAVLGLALRRLWRQRTRSSP